MTTPASVRAGTRRAVCVKAARHKTRCVQPKARIVTTKPLRAWAFIVEIKGKGYINWTSIAMTRRDVLARHSAAIGAKDHVVPVLITPLERKRR